MPQNCLPSTYPPLQEILSPNFGIPKGTHGRNGSFVLGIVIHCTQLPEDSYIGQACNQIPRRSPKPAHASLNYLVSDTGITRLVKETDIAWGFGSVATSGDYCPPDCALNWALAAQNPGVNPDQYTLHIGLTGGNPITCDCDCECSRPTHLSKLGNSLLVRLLAAITEQLGIPRDANHIAFHENLTDCAEECACNNIDVLLCAVNSYCEQCNPIVTSHASQHAKGACDPLDIALIADSCDLGRIIPAMQPADPFPPTILAKDAAGCVKALSFSTLSAAVQTPWEVGIQAPGLTIIPRGPTGHQVDFSWDFCEFGAQIHPTLLSPHRFIGLTSSDCLSWYTPAQAFASLCSAIPPLTAPLVLVVGKDAAGKCGTATAEDVVSSGLAVTDTATIDITKVGNLISADLLVCAAVAGVANALRDEPCGAYVPQGANIAVGTGLAGAGTAIDPIRLNLCGITPPVGVIQTALGRDASGCVVSESAAGMVARLETPETVFSAIGTGGVSIIPGGISGHAPTISINPCAFGAAIPPGVLIQLVGSDASNCLVRASFATTLCNTISSLGIGGVATSTTLLMGADCQKYTVENPALTTSTTDTIVLSPGGSDNGHTGVSGVVRIAPAQGGVPNNISVVPGQGIYSPTPDCSTPAASNAITSLLKCEGGTPRTITVTNAGACETANYLGADGRIYSLAPIRSRAIHLDTGEILTGGSLTNLTGAVATTPFGTTQTLNLVADPCQDTVFDVVVHYAIDITIGSVNPSVGPATTVNVRLTTNAPGYTLSGTILHQLGTYQGTNPTPDNDGAQYESGRWGAANFRVVVPAGGAFAFTTQPQYTVPSYNQDDTYDIVAFVTRIDAVGHPL